MSGGGKPFQVLCVEDEKKLSGDLSNLVPTLDPKRFGQEFNSVIVDPVADQATAEAAVSKAITTGQLYSLVLLDLRYPVRPHEQVDMREYAGLKWLGELRRKLPNALIVVLTAHHHDEYLDIARKAFAAGANDFLPKPTPWAVLRSRIERAWDELDKDLRHQTLQKEATFLLRSHWTRAHMLRALRIAEEHQIVLEGLAADARRLGPQGLRLHQDLTQAGKQLQWNLQRLLDGSRTLNKLIKTENFGAWLWENLAWVDLVLRQYQVRLEWNADKVALWSYLQDLSVIVHELIQNALCGIVAKGAAPDHCITVSISGEDPVVVAVQDSGTGIDPAAIASGKIFEAGHSVWPPEVAKLFEHKGMGLNFVRCIVNQIGGKISVKNVDDTPGQGVRVELSIPQVVEPYVPQADAA
jgi:CheY-like chemotaxis protein